MSLPAPVPERCRWCGGPFHVGCDREPQRAASLGAADGRFSNAPARYPDSAEYMEAFNRERTIREALS